MAIAYDNSSSVIEGSDPTELTWALNNIAGNLVIVGASVQSAEGAFSAIQYNNVELTKIPASFITQSDIETWYGYGVNPATGSHNAETHHASGDNVGAGAITFSGVDTSNPINASTEKQGLAANPFHSITTTVENCMLVALVALEQNASFSINTADGWVLRQSVTVNAQQRFFIATRPVTSTGSYTLTVTVGSDDYVIMLVALKPAAGGPVEAAGTISCIAALTGIGQSLNTSDGTASIIVAATGAGRAIFESAGAITLVAALTAEGKTVYPSVGVVDSTAALSAEGKSTFQGIGSIAGSLSPLGAGQSTNNSIGSIVAVASVNADAEAITETAGNVNMAAVVMGDGESVFVSVGAITNVVAAAGETKAIFQSTGDISCAVSAAAVGENAAGGFSESAGTIDCVSTIVGAGQSTSLSDGSITALASISGEGRAVSLSVGIITNQAAISGIAQAIFESAASAGGIAAVIAVGQAISQSDGLAQGQAVLNAVTQSLFNSVGLSSIILTAAGVGQDAAAPADVQEGDGLIAAQMITSGIGARITLGLMGSSIKSSTLNDAFLANQNINKSTFDNEALL